MLGLGTFLAGAGNAADYYDTTTAGAAYDDTSKRGTTVLEFSLNGAASSGATNSVSVNLDGGDATGATVTASADSDQHGKTPYVFGGWRPSNDRDARCGRHHGGGGSRKNSGDGLHRGKRHGGLAGAPDDYVPNDGGAHPDHRRHQYVCWVEPNCRKNARTETSLKDALNAAFSASSTLQKAGLQATVDGSHHFTVASNNGTAFRVNTSTTGALADIGFGHAGASLGGLTVNNSNVSVLDANGATNTQAISFGALTYGTDDQSLTVSANDNNGALQTLTFTLQNDASSRAGRSLDETIGYINPQLQASDKAALQKVVAVKENVGRRREDQLHQLVSNFSVGRRNFAPQRRRAQRRTAAAENSDALGSGANGQSRRGAARRRRWRP